MFDQLRCWSLQVRTVNIGTELAEGPTESLKVAEGTVQQLCWSAGGQLLAIATAAGHLYCAIGSLPAIAAASSTNYAHLTSLTQATIVDAYSDSTTLVALKFTPHFIALGPTHIAAGMNNRVMFHKLRRNKLGSSELRVYDEGSVEALCMNSTLVAVLVAGRVLVHGIEDSRAEVQAPYRGQDVTAFALTEDFLVIGTAGGLLQHYSVKHGPLAPLNEYMHEVRGGKRSGITGVWAAPGRAHLVFSDDSRQVHVFSCVDDQVWANAIPCACTWCACRTLAAEYLSRIESSMAPLGSYMPVLVHACAHQLHKIQRTGLMFTGY